MADARISMLLKLFEHEAMPIINKMHKDYLSGRCDEKAFYSHVYVGLEKAIATSFGLNISFSDEEYISACDILLDKHNIPCAHFDIRKFVSEVSNNAFFAWGEGGIGRVSTFLDMGSSKILRDRIDLIKQWTPEMALRFGIYGIDNQIGGLYPGEILVLTGHQGSMKTSLILKGIEDAISRRMSVAFFSLDMAPEVIMERRLMKHTGKSQNEIHREIKLKDSYITEAADELSLSDRGCLNLFGNVGGNRWTIHSLRETILTLRPHILVIDFLTLLRTASQDDLQCANESMPILKEITQECGLRTVILSQMSRASKADQRSGNFGGHSKGGGIIEETADCELELVKDIADPHNDRNREEKIVVTVTKNRRGSSGASYCLEVDMNCMSFTGEAVRVGRAGKAPKAIFNDPFELNDTISRRKDLWE